MFGVGDNHQQSNDDPAMLDNVKQLASEPADQVAPADPAAATAAPDPTTAHAEPAEGFSSSPLPGSPDPAPQSANPEPTAATTDLSPSNGPVDAQLISTPVSDDSTTADAATDSSTVDTPPQTVEPSDSADPNHLAGLKQQALEHLEPLADHIGGTPEESFKTTMMMIQANDNHTLLEKALESAKSIVDDKERAQAMLDIINEINYFAQATSDGKPADQQS